MSELPQFDLSQMSFKTDEELNASEGGVAKKETKLFEPGQYDLKITAVEFTGMAEKDPSWGKFRFELSGTGEKMLRETVMVPYKDVKYGSSGTMLPFRRLKNFLESLGYDVKVETLQDTLKKVFTKPDRLLHRHVRADVGYERAYIKYAGKGHDGVSSLFEIVQKDKSVLTEAGAPVRFPSREAAQNYAEVRSIQIQRFTNVLQYQKSTQDVTDKIPW